MSELREKAIAIVENKLWEDLRSFIDSEGIADAILSLIDSSPVERLEVVRKCVNCRFSGKANMDKSGNIVICPVCHGTGDIVRPMTRGETEEIAKHYLKKNHHIMIDKDGIKCNVRVKR